MAIFYADRMTGSMRRCLDETARRRELQIAYNVQHGITPRSVMKSVDEVRFSTRVADARTERESERTVAEPAREYDAIAPAALEKMLEEQMRAASKDMDFELAAVLRDQLFELRARGLATGKSAAQSPAKSRGRRAAR
jgi:excinuclease ABC subunit B